MNGCSVVQHQKYIGSEEKPGLKCTETEASPWKFFPLSETQNYQWRTVSISKKSSRKFAPVRNIINNAAYRITNSICMSIEERLKYVFIFLQILLQNHKRGKPKFCTKALSVPWWHGSVCWNVLL